MKTYIWNDLHWRTIAVQADSLEQAIGYVNLEIEKKKQRYSEAFVIKYEDAESLVTALRDLIKKDPVILEPFKCVIL